MRLILPLQWLYAAAHSSTESQASRIDVNCWCSMRTSQNFTLVHLHQPLHQQCLTLGIDGAKGR